MKRRKREPSERARLGGRSRASEREISAKTRRDAARRDVGKDPPAGTNGARKVAVPAPAIGAKQKVASFPIVAIGASAGGLEALEQFLAHVPVRGGMAYVVIQHLDPTRKGAMVELLQRATTMPVVEVKDRQRVESDSVYVIPPNKDMSILHGVLHLLPRPRGLDLPIDFFFRSLAEDQGERSIGVVLSGMGSDGTLGIRAIKEKAGASFVQAVSSAKFSGMPQSVIDAGLADVVAEAGELPALIKAYHEHAPYTRKAETAIDGKQLSALEKIFILLRNQTGNDFSLYKRSTIYRRIERRMSLHQIDRLANYVRYLRENPHEVDLLFKELLIGVTSFFRDAAAWDHLKMDVLPELLRSRPRGTTLRAWVPGCSTGEEAYSLAILLSEATEQGDTSTGFQIFATDLDHDAIERARQGIFPANIAADVSPERLRRYFLQHDKGFRVRKEIREAVVFAPQNIVMDPPFTKLDILSCRNLLIYLSAEVQKKLIPLFHYALNPRGILFLGNAETVGAHSSLFGTLDGKSRIYRRLVPAGGAPIVDFPPAVNLPSARTVAPRESDAQAGPMRNVGSLADRVIAQHFAPAAVLTDEKGEILYISGRTGKYLEPAAGKANLNVFAMAREGLRFDLSSAFATALREGRPVISRAIKVATNGSTQIVDLTVQRLDEPKELRGAMIIAIADVATAPEGPQRGKRRRHTGVSVRLTEVEQELQHAREEVQTTREEMQTSQEELKSTNEELQSTNEELQSTNEELTTSKEEMQSMNEELQTVNHELQSKVDELSRSNSDMKNLLNSTDVATLFLDGELRVRRFTTPTAKLIKLIPADAGRSITDIATDLDYPGLADDAREVLGTLVYKEREVSSRDGRWFMVRVLPYRTLNNMIDGVVITFSDTTTAKTLEFKLKDQAGQLTQLTESLPNLVWGCRPDGACDYLSKQWVDYTGVPEEEQFAYGWLEQVHPQERDRVRDEWKTAIRTQVPLDTEFRIRGRNAYRWFKTRSVPIRNQSGAVVKWYFASTDVDVMKKATEQLARVLESIEDAFIALDEDLVITSLNPCAERLLEPGSGSVIGKSFFDAFPSSSGSRLKKRLLDGVREQRAFSFEEELGPASSRARYVVHALPHLGGVSLVCRQAERSPGTSSKVSEP